MTCLIHRLDDPVSCSKAKRLELQKEPAKLRGHHQRTVSDTWSDHSAVLSVPHDPAKNLLRLEVYAVLSPLLEVRQEDIVFKLSVNVEILTQKLCFVVPKTKCSKAGLIYVGKTALSGRFVPVFHGFIQLLELHDGRNTFGGCVPPGHEVHDRQFVSHVPGRGVDTLGDLVRLGALLTDAAATTLMDVVESMCTAPKQHELTGRDDRPQLSLVHVLQGGSPSLCGLRELLGERALPSGEVDLREIREGTRYEQSTKPQKRPATEVPTGVYPDAVWIVRHVVVPAQTSDHCFQILPALIHLGPKLP
ncbi:hypothetical protein CBN_A0058, partial [Clostridium botulinum NCTC 2916]